MQRAKWGAMFMFVVQIMAFSAMALLIYFSAQLNEAGKLKVGAVSSFLIYMIMLIG